MGIGHNKNVYNKIFIVFISRLQKLTLLIRIGIDTQNYTKACVMCEVGEGAKFYHLLKYFVKICRSARDSWVRWGSQGWDFCSSYVVPWNTPLRRGLRDWKGDGCDE